MQKLSKISSQMDSCFFSSFHILQVSSFNVLQVKCDSCFLSLFNVLQIRVYTHDIFSFSLNNGLIRRLSFVTTIARYQKKGKWSRRSTTNLNYADINRRLNTKG